MAEERETYESVKNDATESELSNARLTLDFLEHSSLPGRNSLTENET